MAAPLPYNDSIMPSFDRPNIDRILTRFRRERTAVEGRRTKKILGVSDQALVIALCGLLVVCATIAAADEEPPQDWHPRSEFAGQFDWVQLRSGEWVKGSIIAMYDGDLEFDSDEFKKITLSWHKITEMRTSQVVSVRLLGDRIAVGKAVLLGAEMAVYGQTVERFAKDEVMTITAGAPREINFWDAKIFTGISILSGNSDVREVTVLADVKRRTIHNRIIVDFASARNVTDDVRIADNQRAGVKWDKFINDRLFVSPVFGEYYRDPIQNIRRRFTIGVGLGYQLMDSRKIDWTVSGGPAYQESRYESSIEGEDSDEKTAALALSTRAEWKILRWLEFDGSYRAQIVNEASGSYNHHMVVSFELTITRILDFDASWIWDRIQEPRPGADGITPEPDDFRTAVGLTFNF